MSVVELGYNGWYLIWSTIIYWDACLHKWFTSMCMIMAMVHHGWTTITMIYYCCPLLIAIKWLINWSIDQQHDGTHAWEMVAFSNHFPTISAKEPTISQAFLKHFSTMPLQQAICSERSWSVGPRDSSSEKLPLCRFARGGTSRAMVIHVGEAMSSEWQSWGVSIKYSNR